MRLKETKALLAESNKRLVIMGRFSGSGSQSDARKGVTFTGRAKPGHAKLSVADFFEKIAPELRYVRGESVRIGDTAFNSYSLLTPRSAGGTGHGQAVTPDSPLLVTAAADDSATEAVRWQEEGGKLLRALVVNLDEVTRFADGRFSGALLKVTRRFAVDYADSLSRDDRIDRADWEDLAFDHPSSAALVAYMTCYRSDEGSALDAVRRALNAHTQGSGAPLTSNRIDRLVQGLERCKSVLEAGHEDDPFLQLIIKEPQYRYLVDYPSSKYGLAIPGAGAKGFAAHYRRFRECSDGIHRFVRNGCLHSYLFLWLAGKYGSYSGRDDFATLAKELFAHGVEGQGDKRIPGETAEERARNFTLVRDTESSIAEPQKAQLKQSHLYESLQQALQDGILEKLRPDRAFRRDALNKRNRELFVSLGQLAGGKAGQILHRATDLAATMSKLYRAAKNVRPAAGEVLAREAFQRAFRRLRGSDTQKFVDALLEELAGLDLEGEALRGAVCASVVKRIAREAKTSFDRSWLTDMDVIDREVQSLGEVYDLRSKLDVERSGDDSRGMPMTVLTGEEVAILAPAEPSERDRARYTKSLEGAATASGASAALRPATVALPVPVRLEHEASSRQVGVIKNAQGRTLADLVSEPERGLIAATLKPNLSAEQVLGADARIDFGELKDLKVVDLEGLDLEPLVAAQARQTQQLEGLASRFGSYSTSQALIRERYVADRAGTGDTTFTRGARALALGEYLLATPPDQSNLGVADLSNVLGVILDVVEQVADVDDAKQLRPDEVLPADVLGRINLSRHYPVSTWNELSRVLQYHHDQCEALAKLNGYFSELSSIKALFQSLEGSAAEITVYNCTLAEHAAVEYPGELFVVREHPVAAYLTSQADPTPTSLRAFTRQVSEALTFRDRDTLSLQLPLLVTPVALPEEGEIFPVVSQTTLPLPMLVSAASASPRGDVIPCSRATIDIHLCLAAALVIGAGGPELGRLERLTREQRNAVRESLHVSPQEGQHLAEALRQAWFAVGSTLAAKLCMTKWLNICLLHDPQDADHLKHLLLTNCLPALQVASNEKNATEYLAPAAFDGLGPAVSEYASYMPQAFAGSSSNQSITSLATCPTALGLSSGALGIRDRTSKKSQNFGEQAFLTALVALVAAGSGATPAEDKTPIGDKTR